ncbi:MAG: hypothetical protein A4E53_00263 [Pelotomaculum sp. PtaB.Bin104]|nr:MAG: hypothetical protein A4E53_00263 [Pelotomaculum sp. PtaB.Bin104]
MLCAAGAQCKPDLQAMSKRLSSRYATVDGAQREMLKLTTDTLLSMSPGPYSSTPSIFPASLINIPVNFISSRLIFDTPFSKTYCTPAPRPARPIMFRVPDSNWSGKKSGWISLSELLPVPPLTMGESSIPSRTYNPPVPCGPRRDLWPVKASMSMSPDAASTG